MFKVYGNGRGGKHGPSADAARWRALTSHLARNIQAAHPDMYAWAVAMHAEDQAQRVTWKLNRREQLGEQTWALDAWMPKVQA